MSEQWDNLDNLIKNSFDKYKVSEDYNSRLLCKLNKTPEIKVSPFSSFLNGKTAAVSFILSGILMFTISTTGLDNKIISSYASMKSKAIMLKVDYNLKVKYIKSIGGFLNE